jgi:hypothetical protein
MKFEPAVRPYPPRRSPTGSGIRAVRWVFGLICLQVATAGFAQIAGPPSIWVQPQNQFVLPGAPASFSVIATNPAWTGIPTSSGDWSGWTNVIETGHTSGTLQIDYSFYGIPDTLHVYFDGALLFDSGYVGGSGTFRIDYGPGASTQVTLIMDEGGNPDPNTLWDYTASYASKLAYHWRKDRVELASATNTTYSIPHSQTAQQGMYSVVISNEFGSVESDPAILSFGGAPHLWIEPLANSNVLVSWPNPCPAFVLQQSDGMDSGSWTAVTNVPTIVVDQNQVVLPGTNATQFFRLGFR